METNIIKMNQILSFHRVLFTLLLLTVSHITWAYDFEVDGIYYRINTSSRQATVIARNDYDGTDIKYFGHISIPANVSYNGNRYEVCYIDNSAFIECSELESILLPQTLSQLGSFRGCSNLKSIIVPDPVTAIYESAFSGCSSLESITIGPNIKKIGNNAFISCPKLKSVYIKDIEAWCKIQFYEKTGSVAHQTLSYNFTSNPLQNGADLYLNGEKLINFVVPESIESISHYAFLGCSSLESVEISNETSVSQGAFSSNRNLKTIVSFSYSMSRDCFSNCTALTSAYLYNSIGFDDSFNNCPNLRTVLLPKSTVESNQYYSSDDRNYLHSIFPNVKEYIIQDGTSQIGKSKFEGCHSLETIRIPTSVRLICNSAFYDCSNLRNVYIDDLQAWCGIIYGASNNDPGGDNNANPRFANPLHNGADLYVNGHKLINCVIPTEITQLNSAAFYGCNSIETLTIQEATTIIGNYAFYNCKNLSHIVLPSSQMEFGSLVFSGCEKLTSVGPLRSNCSIEYGWETSIPSGAFYDITNLQTIIISSTIKKIGDFAFGKTENIYTNATTPPSISSNTFSKYDATLFVPVDCKDIYSNALCWKNFNIIELVDIESIEINEEQYDIIVGESKEINVTILPVKATYKDLYWSVEDSQVAQVNNGIVTGLKTGTTRVTATTTDGTNLSASCKISVTNPVRSISLSKAQVELEAGESETITASCVPADADDVSVLWTSSDNGIATVTEGKIVAKAVGETDIIAKSANGIEARCSVVVKPTYVTSISLNKHSMQLTTGNSEQLTASILPQKATYKSVIWVSSNTQIASVDETGKVTAKSNGTAIITASTSDGTNLSDKCTVTVTTLAKEITLNRENISLIVGQSTALSPIIVPEETSNKEVKWSSNNSKCATVSPYGVVSAISTGTAMITATTTDGTNLSASCTVNVTNPVIALTLDRISAELMVGQQMTLQATCTPSNADNINVSWSSNNEDIASVNNGVVIAKGLGDAIITARSVNGIEATCKITVVPTPVTSLSLNTTSVDLIKDATYQLVCNITPEDATNKGLVWTTLNSGIASVNESGLVTAMSTGTTTIIVSSASNSEITASCTVSVTTPVTSIKLEHEALELLVDDEVQLIANCMPSDADNASIAWTTANSEIATVSQDGTVTAKNEGEARITATTTDGSNLSASCQVYVKRHKQAITWNQEALICQEGGEMIALDAGAGSGLPVKFSSADSEIVSIYDLDDVVYANPVKEGKTVISAYQQGNYKYEPAEAKREIEVIGKPMGGSRTLVAYYSQSALMDGIVAELTNQIASSYTQVYTQKIEPSNARIDMANHDAAIRDSVMNVISLYPDDAVSYPEIKPLNVAVGDYDDIILVYPIWNMSMAAPMQTFCFQNREILASKSVAYIEYDLFDEAGISSDAKVLRLSLSNIDDKRDLIKDWLDNSVATGILQFRHDKKESRDGIYDMQGRKISNPGKKGLYIIKGHKMLINDNGGTNR